ncbi:MAG: glycoside hydrolase family 2, partial [Clostridia bacterium]|nr:glycoside hydrolase family 2 [Clostridia bacterium]
HSDYIWYHRTVTVPAEFEGKRVLLHFGAADYITKVWLDGQYLGSHEGGYTPFEFDITNHVKCDGKKKHHLSVMCEDRLDTEQPRGKQSWRPENFACWYAPMSGIWQPVWLEAVGMNYVTNVRMTPDIDNGTVKFEIKANNAPAGAKAKIEISFKDAPVAECTVNFAHRRADVTVSLGHDETVEGFHHWTPANPCLYDVRISLIDGDAECDSLITYFGMRKIDIVGDRVFLNKTELYQRLILDQGYWKDGLLTAPTDDALKLDVELTRKLGFNGARKHQKFEDPRYLYWADKLGLLVWGELPSAYWFNDDEKRNMLRDLSEAIARDYNHPSLIAWVPLNESWGVHAIRTNPEMQQLNDMLYHVVHSLDGTRFVSGNDGWEQAETDIVTAHDYTGYNRDLRHEDYEDAEIFGLGCPNKGRAVTADNYDNTGKPCLLTEYGGIAFAKDSGNGNWGYSGAVTDENIFIERYDDITTAFKSMPYIRGYCYTQLTDVFQEVNGLLDMDRNPKVSVEKIRAINVRMRHCK